MSSLLSPSVSSPHTPSSHTASWSGASGGVGPSVWVKSVLPRSVASIAATLASNSEEWKGRVTALQEVEKLVLDCLEYERASAGTAAAASFPVTLGALLSSLAPALATQISDLRSEIVRQAAHTISALATQLGDTAGPSGETSSSGPFHRCGAKILPAVLSVAASSNSVIRGYAVQACADVVANVMSVSGAGGAGILGHLLSEIKHTKNKNVKSLSMELLSETVLKRWPRKLWAAEDTPRGGGGGGGGLSGSGGGSGSGSSANGISSAMLEEHLLIGLSSADTLTRAHAARAVWHYARFGSTPRAQMLVRSMEPRMRKVVLEARRAEDEGTSLEAESAAAAAASQDDSSLSLPSSARSRSNSIGGRKTPTSSRTPSFGALTVPAQEEGVSSSGGGGALHSINMSATSISDGVLTKALSEARRKLATANSTAPSATTGLGGSNGAKRVGSAIGAPSGGGAGAAAAGGVKKSALGAPTRVLMKKPPAPATAAAVGGGGKAAPAAAVPGRTGAASAVAAAAAAAALDNESDSAEIASLTGASSSGRSHQRTISTFRLDDLQGLLNDTELTAGQSDSTSLASVGGGGGDESPSGFLTSHPGHGHGHGHLRNLSVQSSHSSSGSAGDGDSMLLMHAEPIAMSGEAATIAPETETESEPSLSAPTSTASPAFKPSGTRTPKPPGSAGKIATGHAQAAAPASKRAPAAAVAAAAALLKSSRSTSKLAPGAAPGAGSKSTAMTSEAKKRQSLPVGSQSQRSGAVSGASTPFRSATSAASSRATSRAPSRAASRAPSRGPSRSASKTRPTKSNSASGRSSPVSSPRAGAGGPGSSGRSSSTKGKATSRSSSARRPAPAAAAAAGASKTPTTPRPKTPSTPSLRSKTPLPPTTPRSKTPAPTTPRARAVPTPTSATARVGNKKTPLSGASAGAGGSTTPRPSSAAGGSRTPGKSPSRFGPGGSASGGGSKMAALKLPAAGSASGSRTATLRSSHGPGGGGGGSGTGSPLLAAFASPNSRNSGLHLTTEALAHYGFEGGLFGVSSSSSSVSSSAPVSSHPSPSAAGLGTHVGSGLAVLLRDHRLHMSESALHLQQLNSLLNATTASLAASAAAATAAGAGAHGHQPAQGGAYLDTMIKLLSDNLSKTTALLGGFMALKQKEMAQHQANVQQQMLQMQNTPTAAAAAAAASAAAAAAAAAGAASAASTPRAAAAAAATMTPIAVPAAVAPVTTAATEAVPPVASFPSSSSSSLSSSDPAPSFAQLSLGGGGGDEDASSRSHSHAAVAEPTLQLRPFDHHAGFDGTAPTAPGSAASFVSDSAGAAPAPSDPLLPPSRLSPSPSPPPAVSAWDATVAASATESAFFSSDAAFVAGSPAELDDL